MDTLIKLGQKAAIDDEGHVSGWLAPFGGPFAGKDLDGEFFYGARGSDAGTDFGLEHWGDLPILWGHGQDSEIGAEKVGTVTVKEIRDKGLWIEGQLDRQSKYYDAIRELANGSAKDDRQAADLYWSSGSLAHLVKKNAKTGAIKQWPVAEATLTVTPANPDAAAAVKDAEPVLVAATSAPVTNVVDFTASVVPISGTATVSGTTYIPYVVSGISDVGTQIVVVPSFKEGRRHSTSDKERISTLRNHYAEMGRLLNELDPPDSPDPEPEAEPSGKSADAPPVYVLTVKAGDDAERAPVDDLAAVKQRLAEIAVKEARRLTG